MKTQIKTPVRYEDLAIIDADGEAIAEIWTKLGEPDAIPDAKGKQIADALNATTREARLVEALEKIPDAIPTNWLDPLLSGDKAVIHTSDCREIEALLRGVQDRLRASVAEALADINPNGDGK